jgi:pimeloyl-ACP methyl ester carboxylesterase
VKAFLCLFRAAVIGTVMFVQIAATSPQKLPPYDANWYLHPQRLVNIGGRRLNIICSGSGSPSVILEAGLLADSSAWRLVQPVISRRTRVCSYDRAGLGFSDPAGTPRDAAAITSDLHALLQKAGIAPPYVLAGWSSGGLYTRLYQYRFPGEVVRLVEVGPDSEFNTLDDFLKIATTVMQKPPHYFDPQVRDWYEQYDNCAVVTRGTCAFFLGGLAAYRRQQSAAGCPKSSRAECALAEIRGEHTDRASFWRDEALELEASDKSTAEVRAAKRPYGNLPLIVLTDSEEGDIDHGEGPISVAAQRAGWVAKDKVEEHMASLSTVGAHFVVAGSSHAILLDHPSAVISAIDEVVDQARYNRH